MSVQSDFPFVLDFLPRTPIVVEVSQAQLTSDAGLLPIRQFDERIGFTAQLAAALHDDRDPRFTLHPLSDMVRQRVYGILADYEDQNDHDQLRRDPVFKLIANRTPDGLELASQPTLSRLENDVSIPDLYRLRDVLIDQFLQSFAAPPASLTLDIDAFDDPAHGRQQLVLFHGYYEQSQYFPLTISCAENDFVLLASLRHGTASAFLGADDDLRHVVERLRAAWPDVHIHVRGDSGFGGPVMYRVCEELGVMYTFGIGMNPRLQEFSDELLAEAVEQYERTGEKARLFDGLWYQAGSWDHPRYVVLKAEAHSGGTNRRAVVTNRPGAPILPGAAYDDYADRGESENRNKELKVDLHADRLSNQRFLANYFRLYLHVSALNLLTLLRNAVSLQPTPADLQLDETLPAEALPEGPRRRKFFNRRRRADPLGAGQPQTWRTRIIKVAAEVTVSTRRVVVKLCSSWPYLHDWQVLFTGLAALPAPPS